MRMVAWRERWVMAKRRKNALGGMSAEGKVGEGKGGEGWINRGGGRGEVNCNGRRGGVRQTVGKQS